ncbi:hypothetical protein B0H12DRAFT_1102140 [Mycena haematopus]|nr:hypothetical protein B0H12DRAFT_1102140 [Mycena haematopus]
MRVRSRFDSSCPSLLFQLSGLAMGLISFGSSDFLRSCERSSEALQGPPSILVAKCSSRHGTFVRVQNEHIVKVWT